MSASSTLPGLLLLQAAPAKARSWLRRGTVPAYVVPLGGWTAVVPAGPSAAAPPYDGATSVLAARPVPGQLRSAMGFFVVGERAVLVVHPRGGRSGSRWLAWESEHGSLVLPGHEPATVRDLMGVAGLADSEREGVLGVLRRRGGSCPSMLAALVSALALPGGDLLAGTGVPTKEEAVLVTPHARAVQRFDRDIREDQELRVELGEES
ncbi:hypothetical protein [Barrientosiimonas endolithica]|uniref:Uncharacterized protein n=1 Tax=Barrientosiimonas endolithica TaxID=1535208 RepID=A0ABM8HBS2_9MICO|nr:hypothetical protein [Barrientosiimonas endolithica]BDZ58374.1 hypothetical protein GCM10025872_20310 [Barrientosiimonas endolithica]